MATSLQRTFADLNAPRATPTPTRVCAELTRGQAIEQVRALNPSASVAFLEMFETPALVTYLEHLLAAQEPRGALACWSRPGDSPAIMGAHFRN